MTTREATLGLYLSVPFCKAKCTFCNFASDVFGVGDHPHSLDRYVDRLRTEIRDARAFAAASTLDLPHTVDTVYFGGGTPSLLSARHIRDIFADLRQVFRLAPAAEITLECAPGQLSGPTLDELLRQGVNRISLGVQTFVDRESSAVGRLHTRTQCLAEIARLQAHGLPNLSLDLIAGLPYQTEASWRRSLADAIATDVGHLSIYMLEIDGDSRLGAELLSGGTRYHAAAVPTDDDSATFYEIACDHLAAAGLPQYEISNFARPGSESRHNLKYWHRDPYLGFGLDSHSMLRTISATRTDGAVRFANSDSMDAYLGPATAAPDTLLPLHASPFAQQGRQPLQTIDLNAGLEESLFLGLRLNAGVSLKTLASTFGQSTLTRIRPALTETVASGLLEEVGDRIRLTPRGRMVSNEVFSRLLLSPAA